MQTPNLLPKIYMGMDYIGKEDHGGKPPTRCENNRDLEEGVYPPWQ